MKDGDKGMVDLSPTAKPSVVPKPARRIPLSAWIWIVGGLILLATNLWLMFR